MSLALRFHQRRPAWHSLELDKKGKTTARSGGFSFWVRLIPSLQGRTLSSLMPQVLPRTSVNETHTPCRILGADVDNTLSSLSSEVRRRNLKSTGRTISFLPHHTRTLLQPAASLLFRGVGVGDGLPAVAVIVLEFLSSPGPNNERCFRQQALTS